MFLYVHLFYNAAISMNIYVHVLSVTVFFKEKNVKKKNERFLWNIKCTYTFFINSCIWNIKDEMKKLLMGKHCGELHVALCSITGSNDNTSSTEHLYIYNSNTEEPKPDTTWNRLYEAQRASISISIC